MEAKILLIVKPAAGLNIWDTPRPKSQGALLRRAVAKGTPLHAYKIINFQGVPYAWLAPQDPTKAEWVRVKEADGSVEYVDVLDLDSDPSDTSALATAITLLATAIRDLANKK